MNQCLSPRIVIVFLAVPRKLIRLKCRSVCPSANPFLEESDRGVSEVEAVGAEHSQEDGEEERRLEVVPVRPLARHVAEEGAAEETGRVKTLQLGPSSKV